MNILLFLNILQKAREEIALRVKPGILLLTLLVTASIFIENVEGTKNRDSSLRKPARDCSWKRMEVLIWNRIL
jgi:hypothetical protein